MPRNLFAAALAAALLGPSVYAQGSAVVPPVCATLPGNAGIALPLRWSHGTMQVFVDAVLLPANFVGQTITGVWLRRPTLPGDVAYAPIVRTLTVRGGFHTAAATTFTGGVTANRPTTTTVLFGPASVTSLAAAAPGATTTVGDDLLHVVFTQPLPVVAGTLFLEFETSSAPLQISTEHWVDAIWMPNAVDNGLVARVGDGSCTSLTTPTRLAWTASGGPAAGYNASLELTGAAASMPVLMWVGLDPVTRAPGVGYLGFGGSLTTVDPGLVGCWQWAPLDLTWAGVADGTGKFTTAFEVPANATLGLQFGLQGAWVDLSRPGLPLSMANGLVVVARTAGVDNHCNTMFFPANSTVSPWPAFVGQMPVLRLEY